MLGVFYSSGPCLCIYAGKSERRPVCPPPHPLLARRITLSIFPGVLAEDVHSAELGSWYPVALLAAFNVADWAGKSLPGVPALRLRWAGDWWAG